MAEWFKALVLKTNIFINKVSWVQIPFYPFLKNVTFSEVEQW